MPDPKDHRPTTDSFMLAGYEFGVDRDASAVEFDGDRVRTFRLVGSAETFRQLSSDNAFPFDYADAAPTLYAAGVHDTAGGRAEFVSTAEGARANQDDRAQGAYLAFGGSHDVALAVVAQDGWVLVEGTATIGGQEYGVDVRLGIE